MKTLNNSTSKYVLEGLLYGFGATVVMTIVMFTGMQTGISPIPEPIPMALTKLVFGEIPEPGLMIVGLILHLSYGSINGGIVAAIFKNKNTFWHGIGWGILLWIIMQLVVLPILDWGLFGAAITPKIAIATLILHLVYGAVLGLGLSKLKE